MKDIPFYYSCRFTYTSSSLTILHRYLTQSVSSFFFETLPSELSHDARQISATLQFLRQFVLRQLFTSLVVLIF